MKNILKLTCCIAFFTMASSCSKTAEDIPLKNIEEHRKYQNEKIEIGKKTDLIDEYQEILNKNSKSAEALYLLSRVTKNIEIEKKLLDKSLALNPNFYYSILSKGLYYEGQQDYLIAEELYKKAISINPKAPHAHNNLGGLYIDMVFDNKNKNLYSNSTKIEILKKAKSEISKCSSNWELDRQYFINQINDVNNKINELNKKIKLEEKMCSQYEHEEFLRIAFRGLGKSIYQINLLAKNGCSYGWYVLAYNKYGGISTCQIVTTPNYSTGEIECKSVSCSD
jgi:tetratricopeptide (TPR) repeat protein